MKHIFTIILTSTMVISVYAQTKDSKKAAVPTPLSMMETIELPTMKCGMCERKITKAIKSVDGVENVDVNAKTRTAVVTFNSTRASLEKVETAISTIGYTANKRDRNPAAYEKLHSCCKDGDAH